MKKKIAILGSTGSIGTSTLNVIKKNLQQFEIEFLSASTNYKKLIKQAKIFKAKNVCIHNKKYLDIVKKKLKNYKTNVHSGYISLGKISSKKDDIKSKIQHGHYQRLLYGSECIFIKLNRILI